MIICKKQKFTSKVGGKKDQYWNIKEPYLWFASDINLSKMCSSIAAAEKRVYVCAYHAAMVYTQQGHVPSSIIEQKEEKTPK